MAKELRAKRKDAGLPESVKHNKIFRDFGGINTQAKRQAIGQDEFSWIENVMPLGYGNALVVPAISSSLATLAQPDCYYMKDYNIAGINYMFMATDAGYAYQVLLQAPFTVTQIGAAFSSSGVRIAQWKNERILIGDPNSGLYDWNSTVLTHLTSTDAPTNITSIETFSGRVWTGFNRTISFSAPDSYTDFQTASAGGTFIVTDQTLHSEIMQMISANGFLYFTGSDSVNVIGDVNINALGDTVFTNTNLTASVGSNLPLSLIPYYRAVWLANKSGVYSILGSTPQKTSDALDGIFRAIDFGGIVSAGPVMLFNILCTAYMFQYTDATLGETRPLIALFFNKKWFLASQGTGLTLIASAEVDGLQELYATDGTHLYHLFDDDETNVSWLMQAAFWDMDDPTRGKEVDKFAFESDAPETDGTITVTIDTLTNQSPATNTIEYPVAISGLVEWINNSAVVTEWENDFSVVVDWVGGGYTLLMQDGETFGKYVGMSLASDDVRGVISSMMMQYTYREEW